MLRGLKFRTLARKSQWLALASLLTLSLSSIPAYGNDERRVAMHSQGFVYPVMAPRRSSGYGMRIHPIRRYSRLHRGIDLAAPIGSPIRAVKGGIVVFADPYAGYGNLVVLQHADKVTTHYAHCESLRVRPGQRVNAGQIIATVGNTGHSTGPHLHFELRVDGESIDPERVFPNLAEKAQG